MKDTIILSLLVGTPVLWSTAADAQQKPPPSPTAATVSTSPPPSPPASVPPPPARETTSAPSEESEKTESDEDPPPAITLLGKKEELTPHLHGAATVEGSITEVKAAGNTLTAALRSAANAYDYIGVHSSGLASLRLVQEFEVASANPNDPRLDMTLSGKLDGTFRSDEKGGFALRMAGASIQPAGDGPPWGFAFPTYAAAGAIEWHYVQETALPPVTMPAGRFVLVADFVIEATADSLFRGHGEADFKNVGFTVTVKAAAPSPTAR